MSRHATKAAPAAKPTAKQNAATPHAGRHVERVLASAGRPLPAIDRSYFEPRFGRDFSSVRVHTGGDAAASAAAIGARAYTVGDQIVFGAGEYAPASRAARHLLAHELTHVVQGSRALSRSTTVSAVGDTHDATEAEAERVADRVGQAAAPVAVRLQSNGVVRRRTFWDSILGLFAGEDFSQETLLAYLREIDRRNAPEDYNESDNKARAVVRGWAAGSPALVVTAGRAAILVEEMIRGATLDDDEQAILMLLERADDQALRAILVRTSPTLMLENFHGEEETQLLAFFNRRFQGGWDALKHGRITPVGGPIRTFGAAAVDPTGENPEARPCRVRSPGECHTYESWVQQFDVEFLRASPPTTFRSTDGQTVLGPSAAPQPTATDLTAPPAQRRSPLVRGGREQYLPTDHFIDGPTQQWVETHLPRELVQTAYQLACDCADLAVILRHVWLVSHRRTERFTDADGTEWTIGSGLADARSRDVAQIIGNVGSSNVAGLLRAYTDARGAPLRSFVALSPLLRVGDVLVWDHREADATGHAMTILDIRRNEAGAITSLSGLQGNQPIGRARAESIVAQGAAAGRQTPSVEALRRAAGRRVEFTNPLQGNALRDDPRTNVWTWHPGTVLVAAGPPAWHAAGGGGAGRPSDLAGWLPLIAAATTVDELLSRVEAAVDDTRTALEAQRVVDAGQATRFGDAAGRRLWDLAKAAARRRATRRGGEEGLLAEDLGEESHYRPVNHVLGMLRQVPLDTAPARRPAATAAFGAIARAFEPAARGTTSADTPAAAAGAVRVLLTGFDPFATEQRGQPPNQRARQVEPPRGRWNPSGAAILALDGEAVPTGDGGTAAVEGVILPVSYGAFRAGILEQLLAGRRPPPDAVITVSEAPSSTAAQIELFTVGSHETLGDAGPRREDVPASPGGAVGAPIIEARGASALGAEAGLAADRLREGEDLTVRFFDAATATAAAAAWGGAAAGPVVTIVGLARVRAFAAAIERGIQGRGLLVPIGSTGRAPFQLLDGPGGSFLSNEVSYRTLRWIAAGGSARAAMTSFHVHTEGGSDIAQEPTVGRRSLLAAAREVRDRTIETLRRLIAAVARRHRRRP